MFGLASAASEQGGGADWWSFAWGVLVALGVVVGLVAGAITVVSTLRRRKLAKAEVRVLELAVQQLDAEALQKHIERTRRDAAELDQMKSALLEEVQRRVPEQARRVYLENRIRQLAGALEGQMAEYDALRREADALQIT